MIKNKLLLINVLSILLGSTLSIVHHLKNDERKTNISETLLIEDLDTPSISTKSKQISNNVYELEATIKPENFTDDIIWTSSHPDLISIKYKDNLCTLTKSDDFRGFVLININVGSLHSFVQIYSKQTFEITSASFISTTCLQTSKGYYVEEGKSADIKFEIFFTSNLFKTTKEGYLNSTDINKYLLPIDYSLEGIYNKKDIFVTYSALKTLPSFFSSKIEDNFIYHDDICQTSYNVTFKVTKTTAYNYVTDFCNLSFIEHIAPESVTLSDSSLTI